jgi:glycosyltransferase EpsF
MPKVLHLVHSLNRGGIEVWLMSLLRQSWSSGNWHIDFLCKGEAVGEMALEARRLDAEVYHCPLRPTHLAYYRCLKSLLKTRQYDLVHNHLEGYSGFPVWVAHNMKIPVITSFHNPYFDPQTAFTRLPGISFLRSVYVKYSIDYALKHSDVVTGCSRAVLDELCTNGRCDNTETTVLYYGIETTIDTHLNSSQSLRNSFNWPEDTPIVLHVGRFFPQKNHRGVIDVFRKVVKQIPSAKLVLVGDGPLRQEVLAQVAKYSLSDQVIWLGVRDDVLNLMAQSNIFLFPSAYEGFGLVAIEANSVGLPVVGSNIPALREAVVDGKTALLHDLNDLQGMADSVIKILKDRAFADSFHSAGVEWVNSHYTMTATTNRLMKLYERCLNNV